MIGNLIITERGATPRLRKRDHNRIIGQTLAETAANHHKKYMKKHFTVEGGREYGYTPRKGEGLSGKEFWRSYTGQKKRKKGHRRPMVFSGASETLAKILDVRATSKRARLVQHARGLNRRNPHSTIRMNEEIRQISDHEVRQAERFAGSMLKRKYAGITSTITTRIT
jgi:hypothetical protein